MLRLRGGGKMFIGFARLMPASAFNLVPGGGVSGGKKAPGFLVRFTQSNRLKDGRPDYRWDNKTKPGA